MVSLLEEKEKEEAKGWQEGREKIERFGEFFR